MSIHYELTPVDPWPGPPPPHLSGPVQSFDVVWTQGQDVQTGLQGLVQLLQFDVSCCQVVQTLHPGLLDLHQLHFLLLLLLDLRILLHTTAPTWKEAERGRRLFFSEVVLLANLANILAISRLAFIFPHTQLNIFSLLLELF